MNLRAPIALLLGCFACQAARQPSTRVADRLASSSGASLDAGPRTAAPSPPFAVEASPPGAETTASNLPALDDSWELVGSPMTMTGNVAIGPGAIDRHPRRDAVAALYQDSFEGEPQPGVLYVLDAPSHRIHTAIAWDFAFVPGAPQVMYIKPVQVTDEDADPPVDRRKEIARQIGISRAELEDGLYEDGFAGFKWVGQPVLLDLTTGTETPLPTVGGLLAVHAGNVVSLPLPRYYQFPDWDPDTLPKERIQEYDSQGGRWKELRGSAKRAAREAFNVASHPTTTTWPAQPPIGTVLVATQDGRMQLVVVGEGFVVQGARK